MALLWIILPLFVSCAVAGNLTEVKVKLGQNITLNCSLDKPSYWHMEIHSQFRGCIARIVGSDITYYVNTWVTKYIVVEQNRLMITNITAEDCRFYFCARRLDDGISFEDAFHISSDVPITPPTNTSDANHQEQQHIRRMWESELIVYSSFALNVLLVVTGLVFTCLCLKKKNCNYKVNDASAFTCENPETLETPQYEEIQLPTLRASSPAAECIYYKAELP